MKKEMLKNQKSDTKYIILYTAMTYTIVASIHVALYNDFLSKKINYFEKFHRECDQFMGIKMK